MVPPTTRRRRRRDARDRVAIAIARAIPRRSSVVFRPSFTNDDDDAFHRVPSSDAVDVVVRHRGGVAPVVVVVVVVVNARANGRGRSNDSRSDVHANDDERRAKGVRPSRCDRVIARDGGTLVYTEYSREREETTTGDRRRSRRARATERRVCAPRERSARARTKGSRRRRGQCDGDNRMEDVERRCLSDR